MPPLTREQKNAVTNFMSVTNASEKVAQKFMKSVGYRLNDAVDAYCNSTTSSKEKEAALDKVFDSFRGASDDKDTIGYEASEAYLHRLGASLDDASLFLAMDIVKAPQLGDITRQGFVEAWKSIHIEPTVAAQSEHFKSLLAAMGKDRELFRRVYRNAFDLCKEEGQKALSLENALVYWEILFAAPGQSWVGSSVDWLTWWKTYLTENWKRSVSRDMWNQTLDFAFKSRDDETLGFYSDESAWPIVIDDFVAWYRKQSPTMNVDS